MAYRRKRFRDHLETLADYENKLIRVARGKVYWVRGGSAMYVDKLPFTDEVGRTRDWPEVIEVSVMPGDVRNQVVNAVAQIPSNIQEQLKAKANQLATQGLSNVNINPRDASLLPYNAQTKNALNVVNGMYSEASISDAKNTTTYLIVGLVAIGLILYIMK